MGNAETASGVATLAEHWDGTSWSIVPGPSPGTDHDAVLSGVSCAAPGNCYAVGSSVTASGGVTVIEHWDGTTWTVIAGPTRKGATEAELEAVSCPTTTSCTAVGFTETNSGSSLPKTLVERWNGTTWAIVSSPNPSGRSFPSLSGVSCASPTDCVAIGYKFNLTSIENVAITPLAEHWNGTKWAIVAITNPGAANQTELTGVSCPNTANCYTAGVTSTSNSVTKTLIEHWNGTKWARVSTPNPAGAEGSYFDGVNCPTSTRCYAVGASDTGASIHTLVERTT